MIYFFQNVFVYKRRYWLFQNVKRLTIEMIHLPICIPTNRPHPIKINNHSAKQYNSQKYLCCIFLMHSKDILLSLYRLKETTTPNVAYLSDTASFYPNTLCWGQFVKQTVSYTCTPSCFQSPLQCRRFPLFLCQTILHRYSSIHKCRH